MRKPRTFHPPLVIGRSSSRTSKGKTTRDKAWVLHFSSKQMKYIEKLPPRFLDICSCTPWGGLDTNSMAPSAGSTSSLSHHRQDSPRTEEIGDSFPRLVITPSRATSSSGRREARVQYQHDGQYDSPHILYRSSQHTPSYTRSTVQDNVTPPASNRTLSNQTMPFGEQQPASGSSNALKEYYDKHLNLRGAYNSPREKVSKKAPVIAELHTNVQVSCATFRLKIPNLVK
ncbi:MAG: hypothetical protein Q9165_006694 [Trypethelium subeluteriae]